MTDKLMLSSIVNVTSKTTLAKEETHRAMFNRPVINQAISLNTKKPTRPFAVDEFNETTIYNLISQGYTLTISNGKHLNISTRKLLIMVIIKLTEQNSHKSNRPPNTSDLKIQILIDEYIKWCGIPNTRASRDGAIKTIKKDLEALFSIRLDWNEPIKGEQKSFIDIRICSGKGVIDNGTIYFSFGVELGEYLISNNSIMHHPESLLKLDERNPVAFELSHKLKYHNGLYSNQERETANILSVESLLKNSSIQ